MIKKIIHFALLWLWWASPQFGQTTTLPVTDEQTAQLQILPAPINTPYSEYNPSILPDQAMIFFESDRPGGVHLRGDFDIWFARLKDVNDHLNLPPIFFEPEHLPAPINTAGFEGQPFVRQLANGDLELYFTALANPPQRPGPLSTNIYVTRLQQGQWSEPQELFEINSNFNDRMASLSANGKLLFFSSDRPGGFGQDDIWYSVYDDDNKKWQEPQNAGSQINTADSEISPSLHSDGVTLYFSSNRIEGLGGYDIYVTQFEQDQNKKFTFRVPQNLGLPYNSLWDDEHPSVTKDGEYIYFSSNREDGYGLFDIYRAVVPEFARPEVLLTLDAIVKEKNTDKGIEANIELQGKEGTRRISSGLPNGNFSFQLKNKYLYKILITAPGYYPLEEIIDLRKIHLGKTLQKTYELERIQELPPVFRIYLHFENEKGERLQPKTYYQVSPTMKKQREFTNENFFQIEGKTPQKSKQDVINYIKKFTLNITSKAAGYFDSQKTISLYQTIFEQSKYPKSENHIVVVMRSSKPVPIDQMPDSAKALSIFYFPNAVDNKIVETKRKTIDELANHLQKNPQARIYVDGHTDTRGSKALNTSLSQRRSQFIFNLLKAKGISENRMILRWFDYSQPAVPELDKQRGEQKNRRTEVHLVE